MCSIWIDSPTSPTHLEALPLIPHPQRRNKSCPDLVVGASCGMLTLPYYRIFAFHVGFGPSSRLSCRRAPFGEATPLLRVTRVCLSSSFRLRIFAPLTPPSMRISCAHEE